MLDSMFYLFFPKRCPYCKAVISKDKPHCDNCVVGFPKEPLVRRIMSGQICTAPLNYDGNYSRAVWDYKFRRMKANSESFSVLIAAAVEYVYDIDEIDIITSVPMTRKRKRARGFDQSREIAQRVAKRLNKPYLPVIVKIKENDIQHDLRLENRHKNVQGVFAAAPDYTLKGKSVLVIDDVCTSGSTISECCRVLEESGASKTFGAVVTLNE